MALIGGFQHSGRQHSGKCRRSIAILLYPSQQATSHHVSGGLSPRINAAAEWQKALQSNIGRVNDMHQRVPDKRSNGPQHPVNSRSNDLVCSPPRFT